MTNFLKAIEAQIGTPFHWHQRTPGVNGGVDCLGLIIVGMKAVGALEPDFDYIEYGNADADIRNTFSGVGVSHFELISDPEPGCICSFFIGDEPRHLGVWDGVDGLIHAHQINGVFRDNWDKWANRIDEIYRVKNWQV